MERGRGGGSGRRIVVKARGQWNVEGARSVQASSATDRALEISYSMKGAPKRLYTFDTKEERDKAMLELAKEIRRRTLLKKKEAKERKRLKGI